VTPAARIQTLAGDPSFMTSLARGLTVIEAFSGNRHRPTTSLLSTQTGLPRAAVHRCLYTLRRLGFVDSDDERHYYLRPSILSLGYSYLYSTPLASATQPVLERVSRLLHESCSIATLDGDSIVYVARSPVSRIMSVDLRVGSRLPAFCTSMGRIVLASVSPKKRRAYVARLTLVRYTDRTIASKEKLLRLLRVVERAGYAIVDQELEIGLRSIAVPLRDASGAVVAALNASTHAQRISMQEMQTRFLPALQAAAQELSLLLAPGTGARSFEQPPTHQNHR
jgi:IclR family pca regulon transcriptional regulator